MSEVRPINLSSDTKELVCACCGKNLMDNPGMSIIVFVEEVDTSTFKDIYTCCKGECDRKLKSRLEPGQIDGWQDLEVFLNPVTYIRKIFATMNNMQSNIKKFDDEAFRKYKEFLIDTAPYVYRQPTNKEIERYNIEKYFEI